MATVESYSIGDMVLCDLCNKDYTNSDEQGGLAFGSKAVCPDCAPELINQAKKYHEEEYIREVCPKGMSFRDFVIKILRHGQPGFISITHLSVDDDIEEAIKGL